MSPRVGRPVMHTGPRGGRSFLTTSMRATRSGISMPSDVSRRTSRRCHITWRELRFDNHYTLKSSGVLSFDTGWECFVFQLFWKVSGMYCFLTAASCMRNPLFSQGFPRIPYRTLRGSTRRRHVLHFIVPFQTLLNCCFV